MEAAFTADYMEVINCLSETGGVRSKPIKLLEPESKRGGDWRGFNSGPAVETPTSRVQMHNMYIQGTCL